MPKKKSNKVDFPKLPVDEQVEKVQKALKEGGVYDMLSMDGGGFEILDIEGYIITIQYYGACGSCPMATSGTLVFVQNTLQERVDDKIQVRVV